MRNLKQFGFFFAVQFILYAILCWNYRAIARGDLVEVGISDAIFAAFNFTVIKKVAEAKCRWAMAGYVAGGVCGSLVSVSVTKFVWGA